jgi:hypothetical protein
MDRPPPPGGSGRMCASPGLLHLHVMCDRSSGWPTATTTSWPTRGRLDLKGITRDMPLWKNGKMIGSLGGRRVDPEGGGC